MEMEKEEFGLSPLKILVQIGPRQKKLHRQVHFNKHSPHPEKDWRTHANTPGHAIQFNEGIFKGQNICAGKPLDRKSATWI